VSIAAGSGHNLALKDDGTVVAWGFSGNGKTNVPVSLTNVVSIAGGGFESLAVKSDESLAMWGFDSAPPSDVTNVVSASGGQLHYVALTDSDRVLAWGYDIEGSTDVPTGLTNIVAVTAGDYFSIALIASGDTPLALTLPATSITSTTAVLNAMVSANILKTIPIFNFDTTTSYTSGVVASNVAGGSGFVHISRVVTGLKPATTYWCQVVAVNDQGETIGDNLTFTTSAAPVRVDALMLGNAVALNFSGAAATAYSIYEATNVSGPWLGIGAAVEVSSGVYQFVDHIGTNSPLRFYRVSQP
jgi:hypothetical protein